MQVVWSFAKISEERKQLPSDTRQLEARGRTWGSDETEGRNDARKDSLCQTGFVASPQDAKWEFYCVFVGAASLKSP